MTLESEILSSTGALGFSRRTCERGYANIPGLVTADYIKRLSLFSERIIQKGKLGRCVARVFMHGSEIGRLQTSVPLVEAAVPINVSIDNGESVWMCMFARNAPSRDPIQPVSLMEEETGIGKQRQQPTELINMARSQGYYFIQTIPEVYVSEIYSLWGPVFGWDQKKFQVEGLRQRLATERFKSSEQRSVWFTAMCDQSNIVTLAMAERLEFPDVTIVELTEWVSNRRGLHLMEATLAHNVTQVLDDLSTLRRPLLLIAETNFITSAHRVAYGVGMQVPPRTVGGVHIPQLLIQNVYVGDGKSDRPYRDFVMMFLPHQSIESQYSEEQRRIILRGG